MYIQVYHELVLKYLVHEMCTLLHCNSLSLYSANANDTVHDKHSKYSSCTRDNDFKVKPSLAVSLGERYPLIVLLSSEYIYTSVKSAHLQ